MKFPIKNVFPVSQPPAPEKIQPPVVHFEPIRGMGDIVAIVANPIKKAMLATNNTWIKEKLSNCRCAERQQKLNEMFPIHFRK